MLKFQHLILPCFLWLCIGVCVWAFVPSSPFIVGVVVMLASFAFYFSLRVMVKNNIPIIATCCFSLFLLSSVISGFSFINLLLIIAIGTLTSILTTKSLTTLR